MSIEELAEQFENELVDRYENEGGLAEKESEVRAFEDLDQADFTY